MSTNDHASLKPANYLCHLWDLFRTLTPISPRQPKDKKIFVGPDLSVYLHVFLCSDVVMPS